MKVLNIVGENMNLIVRFWIFTCLFGFCVLIGLTFAFDFSSKSIGVNKYTTNKESSVLFLKRVNKTYHKNIESVFIN